MILTNPNLEEVFNEVKNREIFRRFSEAIEVYGEDNLEKLKGKQFVDFSNHDSHGDYFAYGFEFKNRGFGFPMFTAGKNLDVFPINWLLPFDKWEVAIWVDRHKIEKGSFREKKEQARYIGNKVKDALLKGRNLVDFVEGGRNYNFERIKVKTGVIKYVLNAIKTEDIRNKEIYGICSSLAYFPRRIEDFAMPLIKATRNYNGNLRPFFRALYYAADISAFAIEPFRKPHPILKIKFGEPFLLNKYAVKIGGFKELDAFIEKGITKLSEEISSGNP